MPPRPKTAHLHRLSRRALSLGIVVGSGLSGVAIAWLIIANRVPALDRLAMLRNLAAGALVIAFMLVPIYRFRRYPSHVFACSLTAWSILTLVYAILQIPFPRLAARMGTFHFFVLGAVLLGMASALLWVGQLVLTLRHGPPMPARRRAP
jgi:tellurite resistance protein TehA-like permease